MHITPISPGNMKGESGACIERMYDWLRQTGCEFRRDIPDFGKAVITAGKANGEQIPRIGYIGPTSLVKNIMDGSYGEDFAAEIRKTDAQFEKDCARGFAEAADGFIVSELVETEVFKPGSLRRIPLSYYRLIAPLQMGTAMCLVNVSVQMHWQIPIHLPQLDTECRVVN